MVGVPIPSPEGVCRRGDLKVVLPQLVNVSAVIDLGPID
jgi:hypothetical protein